MLKVRLGLCVALVLGLVAGCTQGNPTAPARISGQVKYKGTALGGGTITFYTEGKGIYSSGIGPDGTYEIVDVPLGLAVVTVETESFNPATKKQTYGGDKMGKLAEERRKAEGKGGAAQTQVGTYRRIPEKYANPKTSPLSVTLEAGRQVKEFDLTD